MIARIGNNKATLLLFRGEGKRNKRKTLWGWEQLKLLPIAEAFLSKMPLLPPSIPCWFSSRKKQTINTKKTNSICFHPRFLLEGVRKSLLMCSFFSKKSRGEARKAQALGILEPWKSKLSHLLSLHLAFVLQKAQQELAYSFVPSSSCQVMPHLRPAEKQLFVQFCLLSGHSLLIIQLRWGLGSRRRSFSCHLLIETSYPGASSHQNLKVDRSTLAYVSLKNRG